jgi:alkyl hydroperoxide reductase subunit AhpC
MSLRIGDIAPDFTAASTAGPIRFHEWIGNHWAVLFSHPKDFTPVCTTELGYMARLAPEFAARRCRIIGLSADSLDSHRRWKADIEDTQSCQLDYPMIADEDLAVAKRYGMLPAEAQPGVRTAADNQTVRTVFLIGPDKRIKALLAYPMTSGRNFDELLRLLDSLQLNAEHNVATPVNWRAGDDVIIPPSVTNEVARSRFPQGWKTLRPYLRVVTMPRSSP